MRHITQLLICISVMVSCQACLATTETASQASATPPLFEQQGQVHNSLDKLIEAYQAKNISKFNSQVSEKYTGDADNFETSVRNDFSRFNNVTIRYTVNNITPDATGEKVSVAVTFTRSHQIIKTGKMEVVTGQAELVFSKEDGQFRLYSMKKPSIFGVSE